MNTLIGTRRSGEKGEKAIIGNYFLSGRISGNGQLVGPRHLFVLDLLHHMLEDNPANPLQDVCI